MNMPTSKAIPWNGATFHAALVRRSEKKTTFEGEMLRSISWCSPAATSNEWMKKAEEEQVQVTAKRERDGQSAGVS